MALTLFNCADNNEYAIVSSTQTPIETKIHFYNEAIYSIINLYMNTIYSYATNFQNSDKEELKNDALYLIDKYNNYQNNINYYQNYFKNKFNELIEVNFDNIMTLLEKINFIQIDYTANFPEYYLMVKQTEKYTCEYKKAFDRLMSFFSAYGITGSIMCVFDQDVDQFKNNLNDLLDWIETNNINEDMTYDEVQEQKLLNSYVSYSKYLTYLDDLNYNIKNHGFDFQELYIAIGSFMFEVKLALKTIALGNIIMTSPKDDLKYFDAMAKTMITYQPDLPKNVKLETTPEMSYYNIKGMDVIQYGIPIFLQFREYLKSDWSNFQQILIPAVQTALTASGLYTYTMLLLSYLPEMN